ncbi:SIS domain-containing protein, partial [Xylella fastidiosa]|uniref:SIS domain-containing protein n=1 Tax=Xylella fastidiosa TaxID=2371 RepID=UPI0012AD818F
IDAAGFPPMLVGAQAESGFRGITDIQILACGTSYYAGLTARDWIEAIAGAPCQVQTAREYRYRKAYVNPQHLVVT